MPCERVFSSSKETDIDRRANLSPEKMEQLQILKFGFWGERLTFTSNFMSPESDTLVLDVSSESELPAELYDHEYFAELDNSSAVGCQMETF